MNRFCFSLLTSAILVGCGSDSDSETPKDLENPALEAVTPINNSEVSTSTVSIAGQVSDNRSIRSVTINHGGQSIEAILTEGTFEASITLSEGENSIVVTATDESGNTSSLTRTLILDTQAPTLSNVFPSRGHATQSHITTVRISAADNATLDAVSVTLGDQTAAAESYSNGYAARLTLQPGTNAYSVTATDTAGNTVTEQHTVYFGKPVSGGNSHSGALHNGALYTWGRNNYGQTGLGFESDISNINTDKHPLSPGLVSNSQAFISIAFDQNTSMALADDGGIWSWGYGKYGQLGQGQAGSDALNENHANTPTQVAGITDAIAVTRGYNQTLILHTDGTVSAFGKNSYGQLGDGTEEHRDIPVKTGLTDMVQIASGASFSLAVDTDGRVWSWGQNNYGQLGLGMTDKDAHPTPVQISIDEPIEAVVAGKGHVLALARSGSVYGWGLNASSQVGMYDKDNIDPDWPKYITSPKQLPWFTNVHAIWANGNQSFVEKADGRIYPWGQNMLGTLGVEQDGNVLKPESSVFGFDQVVDLGNGALHTVGMRQDGSVFSWGWSFQGSLGGGEATIDRWSYRVPTLLSFPDAP